MGNFDNFFEEDAMPKVLLAIVALIVFVIGSFYIGRLVPDEPVHTIFMVLCGVVVGLGIQRIGH